MGAAAVGSSAGVGIGADVGVGEGVGAGVGVGKSVDVGMGVGIRVAGDSGDTQAAEAEARNARIQQVVIKFVKLPLGACGL